MTIKLIVGLGNPGAEYAATRHNVGFWLVEELARQGQATFKVESAFFGALAKIQLGGQSVYLLKPSTFMNLSGRSVLAVAQFYKILPSEILVVHDELDLPVGTVKLKQKGGHGGHNGLRDLHAKLGTPDYWRLRIGIDHPGDKNKVAAYVLNAPKKEEIPLIEEGIEASIKVLAQFVQGDATGAMKVLHTQ
jgi:PTH1 family peptidyl-tRNA hydrolase